MKCLKLLLLVMVLFACGKKSEPSKIPTDIGTVATETTATAASTSPISHANCAYSNAVASLGIGVISTPEEFTLFNDSLLTEKAGSWQVHNEKHPVNFCAKFNKPDYGILHFVCLKKTATSFQVLINYDDIRYVANTQDYVFQTWEDYILSGFGVRREPDDQRSLNTLPLRREPGVYADTLTIPKGHELFCPMEVSNDWVKVRYDCFYNDENNKYEGQPCHDYINQCTDPLAGWIRWRDKNTLLVAIFLMP